MIENIEKLERIIREIANEKCSFGNKLLYDMCINKEGQEWNNVNLLADKIWLIGRSYAASPERRYTFKPEYKDAARTRDNAGDGTGKYFTSVAEYIINSSKVSPHIINSLKNGYLFDFSQSDCEHLFDGINSVLELNDLIVKAYADYDGQEFANKVNYRNQVSFCSKFLHFHFPDTVFITDGFSKVGASCLFPKGAKKDAEINWKNDRVKISNKSNPKGAMDLVHSCRKFEEIFAVGCRALKTHEVEYAEHCLRAYKTACLFKMFLGNEIPSCSYPRIVDILLLNIKAK
ncbi:MAG: hypothetical protein PUC29_03370 [Clostridia bacterium]|nr:hypothetical protein [Clostridia bacterium]